MTTTKSVAAVAPRLLTHNGMKIGRVIGTADERPGGYIDKTLPAGDVAVVIELRRRDVFDYGQMFWTGPKILTDSQHLTTNLAQIIHRLEEFSLLFAQAKHH